MLFGHFPEPAELSCTAIYARPYWSVMAARSISTRGCGNWPGIVTSFRALVRCGRGIKKGAWNGPSNMYATRSGQPAPSLL